MVVSRSVKTALNHTSLEKGIPPESVFRAVGIIPTIFTISYVKTLYGTAVSPAILDQQRKFTQAFQSMSAPQKAQAVIEGKAVILCVDNIEQQTVNKAASSRPNAKLLSSTVASLETCRYMPR
jgi:hypothetical protein